jgi:hypothetical protein
VNIRDDDKFVDAVCDRLGRAPIGDDRTVILAMRDMVRPSGSEVDAVTYWTTVHAVVRAIQRREGIPDPRARRCDCR